MTPSSGSISIEKDQCVTSVDDRRAFALAGLLPQLAEWLRPLDLLPTAARNGTFGCQSYPLLEPQTMRCLPIRLHLPPTPNSRRS
jgi:hypothetical protein